MDSGPDHLEAAGRTASADELTRELPAAPRAYLAGAVENPSLTARHVVILLRNGAADAPVLQRIASEPRWAQAYQVKSGLVKHPHTPHPLALNLVRFLFWKDLADVAENPHVHPPLRKAAERILAEKLGEMAEGEKITLARSAGRGLIPRLAQEVQPRVLEALLWNGRFTTSDVLAAVGRPGAQPEILEAVGRHPRWSTRRDIRLALLRNPATPISITMGFLRGMSPADLRGVAGLPETPRVVRLACERLLKGHG